MMDRIKPTLELQDISGTDLVIEAVFEDPKLKHAHLILQNITLQLSENIYYISHLIKDYGITLFKI